MSDFAIGDKAKVLFFLERNGRVGEVTGISYHKPFPIRVTGKDNMGYVFTASYKARELRACCGRSREKRCVMVVLTPTLQSTVGKFGASTQ